MNSALLAVTNFISENITLSISMTIAASLVIALISLKSLNLASKKIHDHINPDNETSNDD